MSTGKPTMGGLVQRKGAAEKPLDMAVPAPVQPPIPVAEPKTKSLTLRLSESQYERLRRHAFNRKETHQAVIERALMTILDSEGA